MCDESWLVTCGPDVQRRRLVGRGTAPEDATARVAAQGSFDVVRSAVDRVVDSSGSSESTRAVVKAAFEEALAAAAERAER